MAFDPTSVNNLALWLEPSKGGSFSDGSAGVAGTTASVDAGAVQTLVDQGGNGYVFFEATNKPTYKTTGSNFSLACLRFNGTTNVLSLANGSTLDNLQNGSYTLFFTIAPTTVPGAGAWAALLSKGSSGDGPAFWWLQNSTFARYFAAYPPAASGTLTANTRYVCCYRGSLLWNSANLTCIREEIWINGQKLYDEANVIPVWAASAWTIGANNASQFFYAGDLASLIVYSRDLSETERMQVQSYLSYKFAVKCAATNGNPNSLPAQSPRVNNVFVGNSLSYGKLSTAGLSYPNQTRLAYTSALPATWINGGVDGQTTSQIITGLPLRELLTYVPGALNIAIIWEITNELFASVSAATAYANMVSACTTLKGYGYKVVVLTCLPRVGTGNDATFETSRNTVNASLRAAFASGAPAWADVLVDVGLNTLATATTADTITIGGKSIQVGLLNSPGPATNTNFADAQAHLNNGGYGLVASAVGAAIQYVISLSGYDPGIDSVIPAIKAKTDLLPSVAAGALNGLPLGDASGRVLLQPAQAGVTIPTVTTITNAVTLGTGEDSELAALAAQIAAIPGNLLDLTNGVETGLTLRQAQRLIVSVLSGLTLDTSGNLAFKRKDGTTTALTITHDTLGNRSASVIGTL